MRKPSKSITALNVTWGWRVWGNCMRKYVVLNPYTCGGIPAIRLTLGWKHKETSFYLKLSIRNFKLWWHSEHLAYRFGVYDPGDNNRVPETWRYKGILGDHLYV